MMPLYLDVTKGLPYFGFYAHCFETFLEADSNRLLICMVSVFSVCNTVTVMSLKHYDEFYRI